MKTLLVAGDFKVRFAVYENEIWHGEKFLKQKLDASTEVRDVLAYATCSLERLQVPPIDVLRTKGRSPKLSHLQRLSVINANC